MSVIGSQAHMRHPLFFPLLRSSPPPPFLWLHKNKMINYPPISLHVRRSDPPPLPGFRVCRKLYGGCDVLLRCSSVCVCWCVCVCVFLVCTWWGESQSTNASPPIPRSASGRMCLIYGRTLSKFAHPKAPRSHPKHTPSDLLPHLRLWDQYSGTCHV